MPKANYMPDNTISTKTQPTIKVLLYLVVILIIFSVAFIFVLERIEFLSVEKRMHLLEQEKKALLSQIVPLQLEYQHLTNYETLYKKGKQYGLVYPSSPNRVPVYIKKEETK